MEGVGVGRWAGLERDQVHQVAFGRSHAVREEVDERVEELRPLGVGLVDVGETWSRGTGCEREQQGGRGS